MPLVGSRYGMVLDASLITGIDPPQEVESALAAINTAHNQVSSDISLAQAAADQKIVQSKRAVEIETLQGPGRSRAAHGDGGAAQRTEAERARRLRRLLAQRAAGRLLARRDKIFWRRRMSGFLLAVSSVSSAVRSACRSSGLCGRLFGFYTIVEEGSCHVYMLFGKVIGGAR